MKKTLLLNLILALQIASMNLLFAGSNNKDSINSNLNYQKSCFYSAKDEIEAMLSGERPLDYERAIFVTENAYRNNSMDYKKYQSVLDVHTEIIKRLISINEKKDLKNFKPTLLESSAEKLSKYKKLLANWTIYKYMTDTLYTIKNNPLYSHLPFKYSTSDPYATKNWNNSQVCNLLYTTQGNCYALTSLFKIFSERLNSDANISTAPGHIFIVHEDMKGVPYNVELASKAFPGSGSIKAFTNTTHEAVVNGISMRKLNLKESISLSLVYLAKGYEHKFKTNDDEFIMQCAELSLQYDSLNLNAMLLKAQVMEERIINAMNNNKISNLSQLAKSPTTKIKFQDYEKLIAHLYNLGYREMPMEIKNLIIARLQKDENIGMILKDHTPNPFKHINSPAKDTRYATLSWGVFDETHEDKGYEQYQRTIFDTKKKKITKFTTADTTYNNYEIDPVIFAWSVDPLAIKYSGESPYSAFGNNPIYYIDEEGATKVTYTTTIDKDGKSTTVKVVDDKYVHKIYYPAQGSHDQTTIEYDMTINTTIDYSKSKDGKPQIDVAVKLKERSFIDDLKDKLVAFEKSSGTEAEGNQWLDDQNGDPNGKFGEQDPTENLFGKQKYEKGNQEYDKNGWGKNPDSTSGKRFNEGNIFKNKKGDTSIVWDRSTRKSTQYKSLDSKTKTSLKKWTPSL